MVLDRILDLETQIRRLANIVEVIGLSTMKPMSVDIPYVSEPEPGLLRCTMGNWNFEPTGYAYQWKRDGTTNVGAGSADFVYSTADVGKSITCVVTATNANGSTAAPPSNAVVPQGPVQTKTASSAAHKE